jgi:hypothetical protein
MDLFGVRKWSNDSAPAGIRRRLPSGLLTSCWSSRQPPLITGDEEVLHTFCRRPPSVRSKSLNSNVIEFHARIRRGVCDNLFQTARKLLILKTERCPSG